MEDLRHKVEAFNADSGLTKALMLSLSWTDALSIAASSVNLTLHITAARIFPNLCSKPKSDARLET